MQGNDNADKRYPWIRKALVAVVIAGTVLRLIQCRQYIFSDELLAFWNVCHFVGSRSIIPSNFQYPTFISYLIAAPTMLGYLVMHAFGQVSCFGEFVGVSSVDQLGAIVAGRLVSVACGIGAVLLTYHIGRRYFSPLTGLLAASLVSFSTLHILLSGYAKPDVAMVFLATAALLFSFRFLESHRMRDCAIAGFLAGLAASTKYNGAFVLCPLVVAGVLVARERGESVRLMPYAVKTLLIISATSLGGLIVGSPGWLIVPKLFLEGLLWQKAHMATGHVGLFGTRYIGMLMNIMKYDAALLVACAAGSIWAAKRHSNRDILLLAFIVPSFAYMGAWAMQVGYYLLFIFPAMALVGAEWLVSLSRRFGQTRRVAAAGATLAPLLVVLWAAVSAFSQAWGMIPPDSRWIAHDWMQKNVASGKTVVTEWAYVPRLLTADQQAEFAQRLKSSQSAFHRRITKLRTYNTIPMEHSPEWLAQVDADFLVTSTDLYSRYFHTAAPPVGNPLRADFMTRKRAYSMLLDRHNPEWRLVKRFDSGRGPKVSLFARIKSPHGP